MIPELWNELGNEKIGDLNDCLECFVEEERNGIFELTLDFPNGYPLADQLLKERIIVVNANDTLLNQRFRIYDTKKFINETITVFARHISFDLVYDCVNDVTFENQSCEYALNSLFRQSQFSKHYRGYSDIVNAQDYSMSMCNILEAIGGKEGSIIDTFGTGAEILRDNTDIHVLNSRGHDNGVTIEYGKNLTGFELSEDTTNLVTRILPYAKHTPEGGKEILIKGNFVDSPLIDNYSHPYVKNIDYTDKFQDNQVPTREKLETLARNEYRDNKVDIPKTNFKIEFIPLSKCVGYEELEDKISICDKVAIKNVRYNVDTKAKVIKYKFDVLKDRYESMELGEPRTSLGDIIAVPDKPEQGPPGPPGPAGKPGADGDMESFPDTLPSVPVLNYRTLGFASIELNWTYEDKIYYNYELYASKIRGFNPNTFDLIHSGQSSSFLFQAKPGETWYFRICAKNTHGKRTGFSSEVAVTTRKVEDMNNYFSEAAIGKAVVQSLTAEYMEAGIIKGHWIDARNFSVTDGNGKRTFNIDSFGRVSIIPESIKIGFNGINDSIAIDEKRMTFKYDNGNKSMVVQGGAMYGFNWFDGRFLGGMQPILPSNNSFNSFGFLGAKTCDSFQIAYANQWDSVDQSTPKGLKSVVSIHFKDLDVSAGELLGMHVKTRLYLNDFLDMKGNDIIRAGEVGARRLLCNGLYSTSSDKHLYLAYNEGRGTVSLGSDLSLNGFNVLGEGQANMYGMRSIGSRSLAFNELKSETSPYNQLLHNNGWNIFSDCDWDWQGHNIVNPNIIGGRIGQGVINESSMLTSLFVMPPGALTNPKYESDMFDQINIVKSVPNVFFFSTPESSKVDTPPIDTIGKLDLSNVVNKEELLINENSADLGKLVTLLFSEVKNLKAEIVKLKGGV